MAQERAAQRAAQQQQLNGYQSVLLQIEGRVHQHELMLQKAQQDHAEALEEHYSDALAEQRAQIVTEAEAVLIQEQMKQQQIKAEYMRSLAQTHAAADNNLQTAYDTIHGLQDKVQRNEIFQAELQGIVQTMQASIDKQNLHIKTELDSAQKHHESEIRQIEAQQALQVQEYQRLQMEREQTWNKDITKFAADLQQSQLQAQAQAQRAHTLQDQIIAERGTRLKSTFPAVHHPPLGPPPDLFASIRDSAGGDPTQAGGDSTQAQSKARPGKEPPGAAGG